MKRLLRRPLSLISEFLRLETAAGFLLVAAASVAMVLANSDFAPLYRAALSSEIGLPNASLPLSSWINKALMAIFFLLVGLEIKRELLIGELSSRKRAILPGIAACGGMILPALIYVAINWNDPTAFRGWAIPAATDIAFALGILAILGSGVPTSIKVFLTALAILDDLGAMLIVAIFYTADISMLALGVAAAGLALLFALKHLGVKHLGVYLVVGVGIWAAMLVSGVHATVAGVAVALTVPLRTGDDAHEESPLHRLERRLHPWVAYGILPLFGLANAGLSFDGISTAALLAPIPLGIAAGLFIGKQFGVLAAAYFAVKRGWAEWPEGATLLQVYGVSLLCGIGFTMSLFIGGLAFATEELENQMKLGVFSGSVISAVAGFLVLRLAVSRTKVSAEQS